MIRRQTGITPALPRAGGFCNVPWDVCGSNRWVPSEGHRQDATPFSRAATGYLCPGGLKGQEDGDGGHGGDVGGKRVALLCWSAAVGTGVLAISYGLWKTGGQAKVSDPSTEIDPPLTVFKKFEGSGPPHQREGKKTKSHPLESQAAGRARRVTRQVACCQPRVSASQSFDGSHPPPRLLLGACSL